MGESNGQIVPGRRLRLYGGIGNSVLFEVDRPMRTMVGFKVDRAGAPNGRMWVGHRTGLRVARGLLLIKSDKHLFCTAKENSETRRATDRWYRPTGHG